ncbi:MAG: SDR family oxidoreductase [Alphaproteobacteria bacterium]|nr:MAG: SDR family oxidoreductase [Alphaproteobacteria bacterium]
MTKTALITGASTGIGRATAQRFQAEGWNVVATMRNPDDGADLAALDNVLVTRLDVTDADSIEAAVAAAIERFGAIDVLVNNAGYGAAGPLEAFPPERIRRQIDTNLIGLIDVTRAVLPHMRAARSGVIVNISSVGGRMTLPLFSLYHATKFAVEGLSEALTFELAPLGIGVKIVEPGAIRTDFSGRSLDFVNDESLAEYQPTIGKVLASFQSRQGENDGSPPEVVADVIWTAATDGTDTLRYTAGEDAAEYMKNRKALDDATFMAGIRARFGLDG